MITAFKATNWSPNEVISEPKMDTMTENAEFLFRNTPRAIYTLPGIARVEGVKEASGRIYIAKSSRDYASVGVRFGNYFSNGCQPIITTGIYSEGNSRAIFYVVRGMGKLIPDHEGFQVDVNIAATYKKNDKIAKGFYVTWKATGY